MVVRSRSSGLRVCTITVPPIEPSSMCASGDLYTSTLPTSCGASSEELEVRPGWSVMNQSAEATVWPLSRVRLSAGSVPRMLIFSPWPKALSMVTPGSVEIASATLVEGNLPTSSAVTTSMIASLLRLVSSACCRLARMPVTTTRSSSVASSAAASPAASWAWTGIAIPRHTAIAVESMDLRCLIVVLPITCLACVARRVAASCCPGGGLRARVVFLPDPVEVPAGGADHAQLPVLDQGHGNLLQRLAHRPLVEEAGDEAAAFEEVADL